ncbi:hypothetical protein JCM33374_g4552 [Metschnikowia sp. JCM 33374]|nr:hypothetical protein JCM33374_g4552 [Metschnikowia sp. JCM 33374]
MYLNRISQSHAIRSCISNTGFLRYAYRFYSQNSPDSAIIKTTVGKKKHQKPVLQTLRRTNQKESVATNSIISSLLSKYNNRQVDPSDLIKYVKPVTSITVGETIDLSRASDILQQNGLHYSVLVDDEIINWSVTFEDDQHDLMVLANGTLVGWGLTEQQMMRTYIPTLMGSVVNSHPYESEEMDYVEIDKGALDEEGSFMQGDVLVIQGHSTEQKQLEMAAFAMGLSRSTRLSILEESLEKHIQVTRENSEILSGGLKLTSKEADVLRLTGNLFLLRGKLNLYSELIETPDLYWTEPTLEKIYESVSRRLDIQPRISIMNRKLDYVTEEQRALLSVLNEKKGTRLEWIIIILIMVEVCFETVHFVEKYWDRNTEKSIA